MEKRYKEFYDNNRYSDATVLTNSFAYSREDAPQCINNDFCISAPHDMNGGILTMAFVDMQPLDEVYSLQDAFCNGTLFPNLNKPFYGGRR